MHGNEDRTNNATGMVNNMDPWLRELAPTGSRNLGFRLLTITVEERHATLSLHLLGTRRANIIARLTSRKSRGETN